MNRDHPLTSRVAVNHIWLRHFGQPLVEQVDDFGRRAPAPSQQQLLDWLALNFVENQWSMKWLHRLMVTSRAYRLSSRIAGSNQHTVEADPSNEFYWRRKPHRMQSQVVRDSLLHLADLMDYELGGPTIDPKGNDRRRRRSLYFTHSRDDRHDFLAMFDDADILRCYRRTESIIPQQALAMANSRLSLEVSRRIASRLAAAHVSSLDGTKRDIRFVQLAFETILCRRPTEGEAQAALRAVASWREFAEGTESSREGIRPLANLIHALVNHNDFISIR